MNERSRLEILKQLGWGPKEIAELFFELKTQMGEQDQVYNEESKLNNRVNDLVEKLEIPYTLIGREYIIEGIKYCLSHSQFQMECGVYQHISQKFGTTPARVERNIRHAITKVFANTKNEFIYQIFKTNINANTGRVANKEFFRIVTSYLKE